MALVGTTSESKGLKYLKHLFDEQQELDQGANNIIKMKNPLVGSFPSFTRVHDWSELPKDISNLIGDKMGFFPHLQKFGAASKEWRGIACEIIKTLPAKIKSEPPVLLLPYNQKTQTATFFEIKNCKKYDLKMPELKDQWICGASNGWLVMLDRSLHLFLFNTGSRARIKLPPLPPAAIAWFHLKSGANDISSRHHLLYKAVLSGDPSSSDCLIAISYSNFRMLGVCRLGDENWTVETHPRWQYYDEIFLYQGKFYAVMEFMRIHVFEYHKQGDLRMLKEIKQPLYNPDWPPYLKCLVESCGDLLHIRGRCISEETWGFEVYKFEPNSDEKLLWSRVYSLGDRSLFLGKHDCICMSVKEFPWCKPNCIYYNDDGRVFGPSGYEGDNGVYSLEENRVVARFDFQHPIPMWPYPAIWFRLNA